MSIKLCLNALKSLVNLKFNIMENKILLRILLIGGSKVGKTSIMLKYINNIFLPEYNQTIVVDCRSKQNLVLGKFARICIFDSPGNEEFSTLTPAYWHLADIIVFVAAYKDRDSLDFIKKKEDIIFQKAKSEAMKVVLLNKKDLKEEHNRVDNEFEEETKIWTEQNNLELYQFSARFDEDQGVNDTIEKIISKFFKDKNPETKKDTQTNSKKKCKCSII